MTRLAAVSIPAIALFLMAELIPAAALAPDLSRYRKFQLGASLSTVSQQMNASPSEVKVIHSRPALIQELIWHPQPVGSSQREATKQVVFTFYNGELSRITASYDRYETEGMTTSDLIAALSGTYGTAVALDRAVVAAPSYGDQDETLAQWQDSEYEFSLVRSWGPSFQLIGVLKRLKEPAAAAVAEAKRLDDKEAPERDAARVAKEEDAAKAKLEKQRTLNKPAFRP